MKKLYFNGDFVPMTGEGDTFEALLVADDGTIVYRLARGGSRSGRGCRGD